MITLIYGEDIVASRKYYRELRASKADVHILEGATVTKEALVQILEGGSLFATAVAIAIEDFFSKRKLTSSDTKEILAYLLNDWPSADIILWEGKELAKNITSQFPPSSLKIFSLPLDVFAFLDSFLIAKPEIRVQLFHKALEQSDEQFIFFMIVRQLRLLLALSDQGSDTIDELKRMSPWQKNKVTKLLSRVQITMIHKLFRRLYEFDLGQKTGSLPLSLTQSLDFLFLEF